MSARRVWIAQCEVCETTEEFDGSMDEVELGSAARAHGWELPIYGGMFCARCSYTVKILSRSVDK